jgi:hypothetical protein
MEVELGVRWGQRVVALGRISSHLQSTASKSLALAAGYNALPWFLHLAPIILAWEAQTSCRSSLPGFFTSSPLPHPAASHQGA